MKCDDDTYVKVEAVLALLADSTGTDGKVFGSIAFTSAPVHDPDDKW